ncbi:hypothetical protein DIZ76_017259 [Coccidioides immitis]|uniref:Uncharacterized protein n=2 Tax=Coccidioides immitis TaxID=5501 RepID=A0A0J8QI18_COCIT|nr:hypothetical protein CIRG_07226 [Coccidioides immitis RMSCC 2394]KMU72004.1 hypothetical protein CISG_00313 [Coccidioides immitis RMSCC 3703]TPX19467.1 hypothetical protein DIZ76_017259 [Coccidioides immitis]
MPPKPSLITSGPPKVDAFRSITGKNGLKHHGGAVSMFTKIRSEASPDNGLALTLRRRTTMISIPNTYTGPHPSSGVVIGALIGAVGSFVLILGILLFSLNRRRISESESVVTSEATRSRHSNARSYRRRTPEIVEPRESVTASMTEEDYIDVYEEDDSFVDSPRRDRYTSRWRSVDPGEYGRGRRHMR